MVKSFFEVHLLSGEGEDASPYTAEQKSCEIGGPMIRCGLQQKLHSAFSELRAHLDESKGAISTHEYQIVILLSDRGGKYLE